MQSQSNFKALLSKGRSQRKRLKTSVTNRKYLHKCLDIFTDPLLLISIKSIWCLTWTSLALISVSFALLRDLSFRRWLLLSMFRIVRFVARLTSKNLLGKSLCYCCLRACHSHSADSVQEKSVSESVHATLSNVWSLRRPVHRAIPVSLTFFLNSLTGQLALQPMPLD